MACLRAIASNDLYAVRRLIADFPEVAAAHLRHGATRDNAGHNYFDDIQHYVYAGDTPLHVAGAAYRPEMATVLIAAGADVRARNRRGAEPLHYASDGIPGSPAWNPDAQAATIAVLIAAGADPNATDKSGVAPLHRAVRTRCAAAVGALIEGGADPRLPNRSGSTPAALATRATGRGASGSPAALAQQSEILRLLGR